MEENEILARILHRDNMAAAMTFLLGKKDSCGIDGLMLSQLPEYWELNGEMLSHAVLAGTYSPQPVILFDILTKKGKLRTLAKFSSADRLLLRAMHQVLDPLLSPAFSPHSFAFRHGTGTKDAAAAAAEYVRQGLAWAAETDITGYFDHIPHAPLLALLEERLPDPALLLLIRKYLSVTVVKDGESAVKTLGLVQGSPISPLLANLYLHRLDCFCEERQIPFIRFADDIRLFAASWPEAEKIYKQVIDYISGPLELPFAPEKSGIFPAVGRNLLGYTLARSEAGIEVRPFVKKPQEQAGRWQHTALERRDGCYHLVGDGILTKKDFALVFENEAEKRQLPAEMTDAVNVYSNIIFDTNFFKFAAAKHLSVNIFDEFGRYVGGFLPAACVPPADVSLLQLQAYNDETHRLMLAGQIILAGMHNLKCNLRYYRRRTDVSALDDVIAVLAEAEKTIQNAGTVSEIMLTEAHAREAYYSTLNLIMPDDDFTYTARSRQPPADAINALISFGNVFLYNEVARQIHCTPLDSRLSFLHSGEHRRESLNLDIAEIYKPLVVDRVIFTLVNRRFLSETEHFAPHAGGGVYLNREGKKIFLRHLQKKLGDTLETANGRRSYRELIRADLYGLVRHLRTGEEFRPFRYH